eukprot:2794272-Pleurochrysis_carterae.AAC.1
MLVLMSAMLLFVLSVKFTGFDRGSDRLQAPPAGRSDSSGTCDRPPGHTVLREPYVPPEVDEEIKERMASLQQVLVPVQYLDNGLMHTIETNLPSATAAIAPIEYAGPIPFDETVAYPGGLAPHDFRSAL